jgi:hypothetical protein
MLRSEQTPEAAQAGSKLLVGKYRLMAFGTLARLRGTSAATTFRIVA